MKRILVNFFLIISYTLMVSNSWGTTDTVIVSAEGLVDPNAEMYKYDKGLMIDDLRNDAKKQALEKVVSIYIDSTTLVENYMLVNDRVLTKSQGLIKKIIKESQPWLGKDGFMHLLIKAEIFKGNTREALKALSAQNRAIKLKEAGNPRISVAITVKDAQRDSATLPIRSEIAENVFKKQMAEFGYRVWSLEVAEGINQGLEKRSTLRGNKNLAAFYATRQLADFSIVGTVKFQPIIIRMKASGLKIKKYALNSWTVKCYNPHTGEELYFNNKIPKSKSWASEDMALRDIGKMISDEFSTEFFTSHLASDISTYQLIIEGLPSYDTGALFKKELIGLRPVLNVDFRSFDLDGVALYEVEFTGNRNHFTETINNAVIKPLNMKFGETVFQLAAVQGQVVQLRFNSNKNSAAVTSEFEETVPSSLASAPAGRLKALAQTKESRERISKINPVLPADSQNEFSSGSPSARNSAIGNF